MLCLGSLVTCSPQSEAVFCCSRGPLFFGFSLGLFLKLCFLMDNQFRLLSCSSREPILFLFSSLHLLKCSGIYKFYTERILIGSLVFVNVAQVPRIILFGGTLSSASTKKGDRLCLGPAGTGTVNESCVVCLLIVLRRHDGTF